MFGTKNENTAIHFENHLRMHRIHESDFHYFLVKEPLHLMKYLFTKQAFYRCHFV